MGKLTPIVATCAILLAQPSVAEDGADGVWIGQYVCAQGETGLRLTIESAGGRALRARFHFYATKNNPHVPEGCFTMAGTFDPTDRGVALSAREWILRPNGYVTVDLSGHIDERGTDLGGTIAGPGCTSFELYRVLSKAVPGREETCRTPRTASLTSAPQKSMETLP